MRRLVRGLLSFAVVLTAVLVGYATRAGTDGATGPNEAYSLRPLLIGLAVAGAIIAVALVELYRRVRDRDQLIKLVMTDELTGIPNRRRLDSDLNKISQADGHVAVAMIDVDLFKGFNDRQGHMVGDSVLRLVAGAIVSSVREGDVVYRYGGEEFAVLLAGTSEESAADVVELVRQRIADLVMPELDEQITVSAGVASGAGRLGRLWLERADAAMYAAKGLGRNRVVRSSDT